MQRDVYAAMIKKKTKTFIPIDILQMSGEVTREQIFDEVFDGHRLRRLVLSTNMRNVDLAQGPKLPRDIVVTSFGQLARVHKPHYQYKLLPLMCSGFPAFAALQGICGSPGSPFQIEHRRDPLPVKFGFAGPAHRDQLADLFFDQFSEEEKKLPNSAKRPPVTGIQYDGVLISKASPGFRDTSCGLMCITDSISAKVLQEFYCMQRLLWSPLNAKQSMSVPLYMDLVRSKNRFHFLATKQPLTNRSSLLALAKEKNIFIYEQQGDEFLFASE